MTVITAYLSYINTFILQKISKQPKLTCLCSFLRFTWLHYSLILHCISSGAATGGMGAFSPKNIFLAPQFSPRITLNVLELAQIWQFQHKNGKLLCALCTNFSHFFPLKNFLPPFSLQSFDAGTATVYKVSKQKNMIGIQMFSVCEIFASNVTLCILTKQTPVKAISRWKRTISTVFFVEVRIIKKHFWFDMLLHDPIDKYGQRCKRDVVKG